MQKYINQNKDKYIDPQLDLQKIEKEIDQIKKDLKKQIDFVPFNEIQKELNYEIVIGEGGFGRIYLINY